MSTPEASRFKSDPDMSFDADLAAQYVDTIRNNSILEKEPRNILDALIGLDRMGSLQSRPLVASMHPWLRRVVDLVPDAITRPVEKLRDKLFPSLEDLTKKIGRQHFIEEEIFKSLPDIMARDEHERAMDYVRLAHLFGYTENQGDEKLLQDIYDEAKSKHEAAQAATPPPGPQPGPNVNNAPNGGPNPNSPEALLKARKEKIQQEREAKLADPTSTEQAEWQDSWDRFASTWDQKIQPKIDAMPSVGPDDLGDIFGVAFEEIQGLILGSQSSLRVRAGIQVILGKIRELSAIPDLHFDTIIEYMTNHDNSNQRKNEEKERLASSLFMPKSVQSKLITVPAPHIGIGKTTVQLQTNENITPTEKSQISKIKRAIPRATHPDISGVNPFVDLDMLEDLDFIFNLYSNVESKIDQVYNQPSA